MITTTTDTTTLIHLDALWFSALRLISYMDEPVFSDAECLYCDAKEYDCECGEFQAVTVDYLSVEDDEEATEIADAFITAYNASKDVRYADMPAYDDRGWETPWNSLNDLLIWDGFPDGTDMATLTAARDWAKGWMEYGASQSPA